MVFQTENWKKKESLKPLYQCVPSINQEPLYRVLWFEYTNAQRTQCNIHHSHQRPRLHCSLVWHQVLDSLAPIKVLWALPTLSLYRQMGGRYNYICLTQVCTCTYVHTSMYLSHQQCHSVMLSLHASQCWQKGSQKHLPIPLCPLDKEVTLSSKKAQGIRQ